MRAVAHIYFILFAVAFFLAVGALATSPNHIQFADTRLYKYDAFVNQIGVAVHAFGDFDSDRYTDTVLVDVNNTVRVFLWSSTALRFDELAWAAVHAGNASNPGMYVCVLTNRVCGARYQHQETGCGNFLFSAVSISTWQCARIFPKLSGRCDGE